MAISSDISLTDAVRGASEPPPVDVASFEDFVTSTGTQLYRTALLLCGDHHLAEDLTQTTYAKLFARWRKVRAVGNPVGYARVTLTRTFLSHRRLRRNSEWPAETLSEPSTGVPAPDLDVRLDLLAALRTLPPEDRLLLVLRYWEDLSVADTADALGVREGHVRTRCHRALARLRHRLPQLATDPLLADVEESHPTPWRKP